MMRNRLYVVSSVYLLQWNVCSCHSLVFQLQGFWGGFWVTVAFRDFFIYSRGCSSLLALRLASIFFQALLCLFTLVTESFTEQKSLMLMNSADRCFVLWILLLVLTLRTSWPRPEESLLFLLKVLESYVLHLGTWSVSVTFSLPGETEPGSDGFPDGQLFQHRLMERRPSCTELLFHLGLKSRGRVRQGFFLGSLSCASLPLPVPPGPEARGSSPEIG